MEKEIVNRVENSGLIQINLDEYYPLGERVIVDVKGLLKKELILVEKEYREKISQINWAEYQDKYVGVICSSDAIIPLWAFMLIASKLKPYVKKIVLGDRSELEKAIFYDIFSLMDFTQFKDKNVIVKGCGKYPIPESVFVDFTRGKGN